MAMRITRSRRLAGLFCQSTSNVWLPHSCSIGATPLTTLFIPTRDASTLFVGGLAWSVTESTLKEAFSTHGEVTQVKVVIDQETLKSRGFAFVTYATDAEAQAALKEMDRKILDGRCIRVDNATSKPTTGRTRLAGFPPSRTSFGSIFDRQSQAEPTSSSGWFETKTREETPFSESKTLYSKTKTLYSETKPIEETPYSESDKKGSEGESLLESWDDFLKSIPPINGPNTSIGNCPHADATSGFKASLSELSNCTEDGSGKSELELNLEAMQHDFFEPMTGDNEKDLMKEMVKDISGSPKTEFEMMQGSLTRELLEDRNIEIERGVVVNYQSEETTHDKREML